jgi:very-short-patch-repair endonuclease
MHVDTDQIYEWFRKRSAMQPVLERIYTGEWRDRLQALREFYRAIEGCGWDPYPLGIDWLRVFTPIEDMVWQDLRCLGVNMWPQYPIGKYVVDFAAPNWEVVIEADGQRWHNRGDDLERDKEIRSLGWSVFRVTGSECNRVINIYDDIEDMGNPDEWPHWLNQRVWFWQINTSEGVIAAINAVFGGQDLNGLMDYDRAKNVLEAHNLAGWTSPMRQIEDAA